MPPSKELISYCLINNYNFLFKKFDNILKNHINNVKIVSKTYVLFNHNYLL